MLKVTLRLYRHQVGALLEYLPHPGGYSFRKMASLGMEELILAEYRGKISASQVFTWKNRPNTKAYAFTIPLSVARALWSELQYLPIRNHGLQGLLSELDRELKNLGLYI